MIDNENYNNYPCCRKMSTTERFSVVKIKKKVFKFSIQFCKRNCSFHECDTCMQKENFTLRIVRQSTAFVHRHSSVSLYTALFGCFL